MLRFAWFLANSFTLTYIFARIAFKESKLANCYCIFYQIERNLDFIINDLAAKCLCKSELYHSL